MATSMPTVPPEFYLRYYVGHSGRYGHEFLEFELHANGKLRYANNSNYKHDQLIRKEMYVGPIVVNELYRIINESKVFDLNDEKWPVPSIEGKQDLEIVCENEHICFTTSKIGSLIDVQKSEDPDGLRLFYFLIQDLKCFVFSLISLHFKIKPI